MRRIGFVAAGVVLGAFVALQVPSIAQDGGSSDTPTPPATTERSVTVSGTAIIRSAPDEAIVGLGVQTQANTAQGALSQNAEKMVSVLQAVEAQGVTRADIATSSVSLYPTYGQSGTEITGYQAANQVDVTVRNMDKVGAVIDAAVGAGANFTNGVTFQVSDQNRGVNDALTAAVENARSKAEALAAAGGARLGQVLSIEETSAPNPGPPILFERDVAAAQAAPTPVRPPTLETQVSVTVVWSLA